MFTSQEYAEVSAFYRNVSGYAPTPLHTVPDFAREIGVREVLVKDESQRLGLPAFKMLGVTYAVNQMMLRGSINRESILVSATDGNHGRALSYVARTLGMKAKIYIHRDVSPRRAAAIADEGAEVVTIDGNYDDSVLAAAEAAEAHGWTLVSDTSWPGYERVSHDIMLGYTMLTMEAAQQWSFPPDLVLVQAGVGGLACAIVSWFLHEQPTARPFIISCEPEGAACVLESIRAGRVFALQGSLETVMAGSSCGTVSALAWPILKTGIDACVSIRDSECMKVMRKLAYPGGDDPVIVAGESGACGVAALWAIAQQDEFKELRKVCRIGAHSRVLVINTEGATNPESYYQITGVKSPS